MEYLRPLSASSASVPSFRVFFIADLVFAFPAIEVEFYRGGQFLYQATTWAGYIGILTAVRAKQYSVSINFRCCHTGNLMTNISSAIRGGWPVAFCVRHVLENCDSFDNAVRTLSNERLVAPTYITIAGTSAGQGALITRDRTIAERALNMSENDNMIVQTNADFWDEKPAEDILASVARRKLAKNGLAILNRGGGATLGTVWALMRSKPIRNPVTIYTSLMCAADSFMESWIEAKTVVDADFVKPSVMKR